MRPLAVAALLALALAASGCGGGSSSSSAKSASSTAAGSTPAAAPGAVSMKGLRFHPDRISVKVGEKVTWTNDEAIDHNVTATGGAKFMSKAFGQGKTYSYTPRKAGTIKYVCTLHPGMKGTLVVKR
jgi:plastocyanin